MRMQTFNMEVLWDTNYELAEFLQPAFLQRCLLYKIHARRKKRYALTRNQRLCLLPYSMSQ